MQGRRLFTVMLTLMLLISLSSVVAAQTAPPSVEMGPGSTSAAGQIDAGLVRPNQTLVAILGNLHPETPCTGPDDPTCELLGMSTVNADGTWNVSLARAAKPGECFEVWFSFDNGSSWELWVGCDITWPLLIPEPATMALVGLGVAGLAGYMRRRRR